MGICGTDGTAGFGAGEGWIVNDDGLATQPPYVEYNYHCRQ